MLRLGYNGHILGAMFELNQSCSWLHDMSVAMPTFVASKGRRGVATQMHVYGAKIDTDGAAACADFLCAKLLQLQ